jgi:hypothetical protein
MTNLLTVGLRGLRGVDGGTVAPAARRAMGIEARFVLLAVVTCVAVLALGAASAQALPRSGSSNARPAAVGAPTVDSESASNALSTSAQLSAQINPNGTASACEFQYIDDTDFQSVGFSGPNLVTVPCSPANLGTGSSDVTAIAQISGLTPNTLYDFRAVVNAGTPGEVDGFDDQFFSAPAASIDSLSASNIGPNSAELDTQINPEGTDTTCQFEYVDDTDFQATGFTGPNVVSMPCSPADLGAETSDQPASLSISGLTPTTTYDFEVIATNALTGPNGVSTTSSFTTTAPVTIDSQSVSNVTSTTATLNAQLNPNGLDTTYQFVISGPGFNELVPGHPVDIGSGTTDVGASANVSGLTPGDTYTYHVTATNSAGTSNGNDQTFTTFPAQQAATGLPDSRGYEQVTPANKDNGEPYLRAGGILGPITTASSGNAISWFSLDALPGSRFDGAFYITRRGSDNWTTSALIPPQGTELSLLCATISPQAVGYSSDLSKEVLADGGNQPFCSADDPPLVSGEPSGAQNLFVVGGSSPLLVDPSPIAGGTPQQATFDGASSDLSTVVFDEQAQLTPDAPGVPEGGSQPDVLYASTPSATANPAVKLVTVLPDGTPVDGTLAGAGASSPAGSEGGAFGAISADGSKIFFTATPTGSSTTNLYVRENPMSSSASTTQVDSGIGGGGVFLAATSDGSNVYFMDGAGNNLYDYNTTTNHLTDLTPGGSAGIDGLAGLNSTGSGLYFVANSVLASNSNSFGQAATDGQPNLYLLPNGDPTKTTFIATLSGNDSSDWSESSTSRVSGNGSFIAFTTTNALNTSDPTNSVPHEIYVFNSGTGKLNCGSCAPGGSGASVGAGIDPPLTPVDFANGEFLQHYVSNSGQLFFDTPDALLPAVQNNGVSDVYEWEADGTGSCSSSAANGGCLSLLSGGQSSQGSYFADASPDGNNVFFATFSQLVPQDTDTAPDYYDARVDGGFPATAPPSACQGDSCKPPETATPPVPVVATVTFFGPGNVKGSTTSSSPKKKSKKKKKHAVIAVLTQRISGNRVKVRITVPARGSLSVAGAGLTGSSRYVRHAGVYTLVARLKPRAMAALETKHKLRLTIRVRYVPAGGHASAAVIKLTVKA